MTTHIDTLAEWWDNAEDAPASPGDRIIERHVCDSDDDTYYTIGVHREGMRGLIGKSGTRILSRAPKPEPAWHDASAVIARTHAYSFPRVFAKDENGIWNDALAGRGHSPDALLDVTPLIEAKVTDEMVERLEKHFADHSNALLPFGLAPRMIAAALGLDPA